MRQEFPHGEASRDGGVPDVVTVREAAAILRVSTATVYALCDKGALPYVRVLHSIRIPAAGLKVLARGSG